MFGRARRVVGTKTPPFDWVQGLFEEGAEDRGVYLAPIVGGGLPCRLSFVCLLGECTGRGKVQKAIRGASPELISAAESAAR